MTWTPVISMISVIPEAVKISDMPWIRHRYFQRFGMTMARLRRAAPDAIVMHPGPMNRGVEIASEVADGSSSVILEQVANGVAVRMAVLYLLAGSRRGESGAAPGGSELADEDG